MLEVEHLRFHYPDAQQALEFTFQVAPTQCLAVTGPSGCGKSTLLNLIAGFLTAESGLLHWQNDDLKALPPWERPVTSVFQEGNLFDHLSVRDNLALGIHPGMKISDRDESALRKLLQRVGLDGMAARHPTELSGGQRQRVAFARALLRRPPLLLLDEPFTGLDSDTRHVLHHLLLEQKRDGTAIVLVSHDEDDVAALADKRLDLTT